MNLPQVCQSRKFVLHLKYWYCYFCDVPPNYIIRKAVCIFIFSRFPAGWPVWPSDLGYELIMRKVVPFPTCFSHFGACFQRPSVAFKIWGINFCRFREMACELFLLLASRSLLRCIQSPYSGLTIGGNVFLPLIKLHRVKFGRHIWWHMVPVAIAKVSLSLDCTP